MKIRLIVAIPIFILLNNLLPSICAKKTKGLQLDLSDIKDGDFAFKKGKSLLAKEKYEDAAQYFWASLIKPGKTYTMEDAYVAFVETFQKRGIPEEAFIEIAKQYLARKQTEQAVEMLKRALEIKPDHIEALKLLSSQLEDDYIPETPQEQASYFMKVIEENPTNAEVKH